MPTKATNVAAPVKADEAADTVTVGEAYTPTYGSPTKRGWRVGVVIKTGRQQIKDVLTYIPIPQQWPEQNVRIFKEQSKPNKRWSP
jgi:hypothetical protein